MEESAHVSLTYTTQDSEFYTKIISLKLVTVMLLDQLAQLVILLDNVLATLGIQDLTVVNVLICTMKILDLAQVTNNLPYSLLFFISLIFQFVNVTPWEVLAPVALIQQASALAKKDMGEQSVTLVEQTFMNLPLISAQVTNALHQRSRFSLRIQYHFLACPSGWFYHDGACFKVSGVKKTFLDAVAACGAETAAPAKLFEPTSEAQNEAIFDIMKNIFGDETEYFVGIKLDPNDPDGGT